MGVPVRIGVPAGSLSRRVRHSTESYSCWICLEALARALREALESAKWIELEKDRLCLETTR